MPPLTWSRRPFGCVRTKRPGRCQSAPRVARRCCREKHCFHAQQAAEKAIEGRVAVHLRHRPSHGPMTSANSLICCRRTRVYAEEVDEAWRLPRLPASRDYSRVIQTGTPRFRKNNTAEPSAWPRAVVAWATEISA